jgi:molecular chaperone DnaK
MRRGEQVSVGKFAYSKALDRPQLVQTSFKRLMGTEARLSVDGVDITPEELSAEVLKSLRSVAEARFAEPVTAAVVTIPAMFTQSARDATIRAAELAGITQVHLLQEPVAAGLAYGANGRSDAGYVLVYDLGGGTFDACLLSIRDGRLQVVDHAGDEYLGGKDLDEIVMDLIIDRLRTSYSLPDVIRADDRSRYPRLKYRAEEAKIELSKGQTTFVNIDGFSDLDGRPINEELEISRAEYEPLIEPLVERTIEIITGLLVRNSLQASAINLGIAVGGPTHTPYLRRRVEQALGFRMDSSIDPMTVVAQGAALYAGMQFREKTTAAAPAMLGAMAVDLRYQPVSESQDAVVGGRLSGDRGGMHVEIDSKDGSWTSGRVAVAGGTFVTTVRLKANTSSTFGIRGFTSDGSLVRLDPEEFSIRHDLVADQAARLPRSLAIAVQTPGSTDLRAEVVVARGAIIPTTGRLSVRTTAAIAPGSPVGINFHLVEGEAQLADRNDHVGQLRIDGTVIQRPLPVDSEVEIRLSVDERLKTTMNVFVPLLDEGYEVTLDQGKRPVPSVRILEHQLQFEQDRLANSSQAVTTGHVTSLLGDVQGDLEAARGGDADQAIKAERALHRLQIEVDRVAEAARLPLAQQQWRQLVADIEPLIAQYGSPAHGRKFAELRSDGEDALASGNAQSLAHRTEAMDSLRLELMREQPGWWIGLYQYLVEQQATLTDQATARLLIQETRSALDRQDFETLKEKCRALVRLLPDGEEGLAQALPDVKIRV